MSPRRLALPILAAVLLVVLAILFLPPIFRPTPSLPSSLEPNPSEDDLQPVTLLLGFQPDVQFAPFYLAQQGGYFADAGLEVTIEHSNDVIPLVADGQAEFGVADATDVMIARTSGIPIKYVSTLYAHFPVVLIGAQGTIPIEPQDLVGLQIGTPGQFGSSWHALLALLDAGGLTQDDVMIRAYPQFNQVEGLLNGDVDVITGFVANEPLRLEAQGLDVQTMTVDDFAPLPGPGIVVGDELLDADPDTVRRFAAAVVRAQNVIDEDPLRGLDAAIIEVPAIGDDRATALAVLETTIRSWDPGLTAQTEISGRIIEEIWLLGYATMQRLGFIDGSVPVDEMFDIRVMGQAD